MAMKPQQRRRPTKPLQKTTIRDFGGGLNVIDTEQNLTSRFSPVFDNTIRYADGSVSPRYGYEKWLRLKTGVEQAGTFPAGVTLNFTLNSPVLVINWAGHPFVGNAEHVTLSGLVDAHGVPASALNQTFGVKRVDANSFQIFIEALPTSNGTDSLTGKAYVRDTHAVGGRAIRVLYFNEFLIIVSSIGEIVRVDIASRAIQRLWDFTIASALGGSPAPWRRTEILAFDYWSGQVIMSNGRDKPLRIDFNKPVKVDYLVDPGMSSSNVAIPAFNACKSAFRYFTVHDTDNTVDDNRTVARISSKNTAVVFSGSTDPGDATDADVSKMLASSTSEIIAFAVIKNFLMAIMPTTTVLLQLGNYVTPGGTTDSVHEPVPADTMPNFGTSAPNSVVEVGNDVFMLDYNGVPSARLSTMSSAIVPERVSQLIEPMLSKHIGRLSLTTMRKKAFGTYDPKNKGVQFVLPKYDDEDVRNLTVNPLAYNTVNVGTSTFFVLLDNHQIEVGDKVTISGASAFGQLTADILNSTLEVVGVVTEDVLVVQYNGDPIVATQPQSGGGVGVQLKPENDGSIVYLYHYVPALRINSWSRFKTRTFNSGCATSDGTMFLVDDGNVYRYGSISAPVYGDDFGAFDANWANSTLYLEGALIRDADTFEIFRCLQEHTSPATGTFALSRELQPLRWEEYEGEPIEMTWELPWADFGTRQELKMLQFIHIDATGTGQFQVDAFVDNVYNSSPLGELIPARSITFTAGDSGGYGRGDQPYGAGRRTREQFVWSLPVRFKLLKLRIASKSTKPIRINAISFLYHKGGLVRT